MVNWLTLIFLFFSIQLFAQPLVHQEKHYVPIIENRHTRILNVVAKRGDTTQFHIHENNIGYFTISGSKIWLQELNGSPRTVNLPSGWAGSDTTHAGNPMIHRFANIGENDFQLIAVEILSNKYFNNDFSKVGISLHENRHFSMQIVNEGTLSSDVPWVLIELLKAGGIESLDLVKPRQELELIKSNDSTSFVIIQFK
jgi:hypothetical protein